MTRTAQGAWLVGGVLLTLPTLAFTLLGFSGSAPVEAAEPQVDQPATVEDIGVGRTQLKRLVAVGERLLQMRENGMRPAAAVERRSVCRPGSNHAVEIVDRKPMFAFAVIGDGPIEPVYDICRIAFDRFFRALRQGFRLLLGFLVVRAAGDEQRGRQRDRQ